jgi:hypothetical protein
MGAYGGLKFWRFLAGPDHIGEVDYVPPLSPAALCQVSVPKKASLIRPQSSLRSPLSGSKRSLYRAPFQTGVKLKFFWQSDDFNGSHSGVLAGFFGGKWVIEGLENDREGNPREGPGKGVIWDVNFGYFKQPRVYRGLKFRGKSQVCFSTRNRGG